MSNRQNFIRVYNADEFKWLIIWHFERGIDPPGFYMTAPCNTNESVLRRIIANE